MNKKASILIILFLIITGIKAQEIVISGNYFGKNLYILNPSVNESSFCIDQVLVNGKATTDEINANSFEIDFAAANIEAGAAVVVTIKHKQNCTPKIINPEVLKQQGSFSFASAKLDKTGKLIWTIKGNVGEGLFIIEQNKWQKWVDVGDATTEIPANGIFTFTPKPHSGPNVFRIRKADSKGLQVYSKEVKFISKVAEVMLNTPKVTNELTFSAETAYEIYDDKGNFIQDGSGQKVDVTNLTKGKYWVNYDNKSENFTKK